VRTAAGTRRLVFPGTGPGGQRAAAAAAAHRRRRRAADRIDLRQPAAQDARGNAGELIAAISGTLANGNVIIPAFAVGRTQAILYALAEFARSGRLPPLRVFIDSPMAEKSHADHAPAPGAARPDVRELDRWMRGNPAELQLRYTHEVEESMALNQIRAGAIIISASGMCDAGRIKHHLRWNLPRSTCAVLITGFQAEGTLGRRLVDGARSVRIFNDDVPVRARLHTIGGLSAHADRDGLLAWLRGFAHAPARTFVVHGERATAAGFADEVKRELGWTRVEAPQQGDAHTIS